MNVFEFADKLNNQPSLFHVGTLLILLFQATKNKTYADFELKTDENVYAFILLQE
jgi:hypothetical protein